jgi:hypothetical protein
MPEKIADAGGESFMKTTLKKTVIRQTNFAGTYKANNVAKDRAGRQGIQATDDRLDALDQFGIAISEVIKCSGLPLDYSKDRFSGFARIDLRGEWVLAEIFLRSFGILGQGGVEDGLEVGVSSGRMGS